MNDSEARPAGLRPGFTPLGVWALSIGASIGWGSFIVTCNTYLQKSGLLGTVFGLLVGMAVIFVITWNLQYMIQAAPGAGGVYAFQKRIGGKDLGFLTLWFVLLTYLAILWANITSVPLFARFFLGDAFRFGFHYQIFGYEVWFGEALLSICAAALVGLLCARSARLSNGVMIAAALVFALGFTVCTVIAVLRHGSGYSYAPLYAEGSGAFAQIVRIAAISPWAFIGFENISHFSEEFRFPLKKVRGILIASVAVTTALYLCVSLLSVSAYPPEYESWLAYIRDMGNLDGIKAVPAFYAADHYLGAAGVTILMAALFGVILTSLISNLLALSRLMYAAGRDGEAPRALAALNARAVPAKAILAVVAVSCCIPFLGRTAIGWIVDVTTLGATLIYGLVSLAVFRHAQQARRRTEQLTGALGVALMACFLLLLLIPGLLPFHAMETESYILFIVWAVLGLVYFRILIRRDHQREYGQRVVVWVFLLVLVLFASMMWVSRATENAANDAVDRIYEYHQSHPEHDTEDNTVERVAYLHEQAKAISRTNTLYTVVSLGLFLIFIAMMLNNYQENRRLGARLTEAERAAKDARRIAELTDTITALLDNMPGMTFTKNAETGVYLACNQPFAEYARKESPKGVVGLTDAQIFDAETAAHIVADDRMALSMDGPYIFFEDVPDAAGNRRQLQTTKRKYIDGQGRLCVLGVCQDVTDMVRIQRENALTKEAYEKARSTGLIFTHIAQALAQGYSNLFYVDLESGDFTEYRTGGGGALTEARRGTRFFDEYMARIERLVYPDDREGVMKALNRQALTEALDRSRTFSMTFRLLAGNEPYYASLRVSRMEDDERCIVIGVTNVDEQMKQRAAAERAMEEQIAYDRVNALNGDFLCIYIVGPKTWRFRRFSASERFADYGFPEEGMGFFPAVREWAAGVVHPDDLDRFLSAFTQEGVMAELDRGEVFSLRCRLMRRGEPGFVLFRLAKIVEKQKNGPRIVFGISDIDAQARQEEEYARNLAAAQRRLHVDALTGVKNRHAYLEAEAKLDREIREQRQPEFAIVVLDVNDLKKINDSAGHQVGDQCIRDACAIICDVFSHSPVFRIGGDEFAVLARGRDCACLDALLGRIDAHSDAAAPGGEVVIARGMARYENDPSVAAVFERADQRMYENKTYRKTVSAAEE